MNYIMKKARPDLLDNFIQYSKTGNVHDYFKDYFGKTAKGGRYDWVKNPCARLVVESLDEMNLNIAGFWGSPWRADYPYLKLNKDQESEYLISHIFIEYNGWTRNGSTIDYNDALWFSWKVN